MYILTSVDIRSDFWSDTADNILDFLTQKLAGADEYMLAKTQQYLNSSMYNVPDMANNSVSAWLQSSTLGLWAVLFSFSVIVGGISMIWQRKMYESGRALLQSFFTMIMVVAVGNLAIALIGGVADSFTRWVIFTNAIDVNTIGVNLRGLADTLGAGESLVLFILALGICLGTFAVLFALVVRPALLILLAGILPLAASVTNMSWGKNWFQQTISWIVSFVAFKPVVAVIFVMGGMLGATVSLGDMQEQAAEEICAPGSQNMKEEEEKLISADPIKTQTYAQGVYGYALMETAKGNGDGDMSEYDEETAHSYCITNHEDEINKRAKEIAGEGFGMVLMGMSVLGLAGFALPALVKFITPAVAGAGSAGGAALGGAAVQTATGAAMAGAAVGFGAARIGGRAVGAVATGGKKKKGGGSGEPSGAKHGGSSAFNNPVSKGVESAGAVAGQMNQDTTGSATPTGATGSSGRRHGK
ncbi:MAG: hypothetical protein IKZ87_06760 [Actinomycetaceae bacterium]|nr:hypothetical protein [Actinomycetaceae bacterium]